MRNLQTSSLHFAVRLNVLLKYGGQLLVVFSVLCSVVFLFSLVVQEYRLSWVYGLVILATGAAGYLLHLIKAPTDIQHNEALVLSAGIFVIIPLIVTIPFQQSGLSFIDAFFEAVSGITTTGLSTLPSVEHLPRTFLFSRAWLQWTGGLGIVVLSIAILHSQSTASLRLFSESWGRDDLISSTRSFARIVVKIYLLLTILGTVTLLISGIGWFDSVTYIFSSVSTGGFSIHDNSLADLPGWLPRATVIFFSLLGALSLALYHRAFEKGWRRLLDNPEFLVLLLTCTAASLITVLFLRFLDGFSLKEALFHGPLMAFSAQTTTGFSSLVTAELSPATQCIIILMMFVGGTVGSTAGGIKIMRLLIVLKTLRLLIIGSGLASGTVVHASYGEKRLDPENIERCYQLIFLFLIVIVLSWLMFIIYGYSPLPALFEVVSATGTVGLSSGISGTALPWQLKTVLCVDMLMGRLEIVAFLVLCYPPTWFGKKRGDKP